MGRFENLAALVFYGLNALAAFRMFYFDFKGGLFAFLLLIPLFTLVPRMFRERPSFTNKVFLAYLGLCLASFIFYLDGNTDPSLFFYGVSYNVAPMSLYMVGHMTVQRGLVSSALRAVLWSNFALLASGIALFLLRPGFYQRFEELNDPIQFALHEGVLPRMSSYMNSMITGNIAVISLAILPLATLKRLESVLLTVVFVLASVMSLQRSSWAMLVMLVIVIAIRIGRTRGAGALRNSIVVRVLRTAGVMIGLAIPVAATFTLLDEEMIARIGVRLAGVEDAVGERGGQWDGAVELIRDHPIGVGIGAAGHKAVDNAAVTVPDGNYFRIAAEVGLFGLGVFLLLLAAGFFGAVRTRNGPLALALAIFALQSIGNNFYDLYYSAHLFWFLLGLAAAGATRELTEQDHRPEEGPFEEAGDPSAEMTPAISSRTASATVRSFG